MKRFHFSFSSKYLSQRYSDFIIKFKVSPVGTEVYFIY